MMTPFLDAFDPAVRFILQALLNTLWPGMLVVGMAWLSLQTLGRTSAASRHAIWLISLFVICALPFLPTGSARLAIPTSTVAPPLARLAATLTRPSVAVAPADSGALSLTDSGQRSSAGEKIASGASAALLPAEKRAGDKAFGAAAMSRIETPGALARWSAALLNGRLPLLLVVVWASITAFLLGRIAWSFVHLFRLRCRLGLLPASDRARGQALAEIYGIDRPVRFFTSARIGGPMTIGWLRPLIILPPDILSKLSAAELDSILAHELAHIKRWDYPTNLLQKVAQAIFFFHPAVWIIGRELTIERELACDDWALKMTGEPRRYATCLTKMVEALGSTRPLALATGIIFGKHLISRRIEMILNRQRNATTAVSKSALLSAVGTAGLAITMCTFFAPVIAVPLGQERLLAKQAARPATPGPRAEAPQGPVAPATPGIVSPRPAPVAVHAPAVASFIDPDDLLEAPEPVEPALALAPEAPVFELLDTLTTVAITPRPSLPARMVSYNQLFAPQPAGQVGPAPVRTTDNKTPALISESELLTVLTDIVKRDTDPSVRNEALRGIYGIRTDAGINALISLYDSIPDVKTKGDIVEYLMRREGDNSKATAKLLQIAKSEKDETLRSRALRQLSRVKGDDGATHLIGIYDSLQDPKEKQLLIRYLGMNKSRKAIDKLIQIAKNDTDPGVRQSAIRSIYAIDNNLYLDLRGKGINISENFKFAPQVWDVEKLREDAFRLAEHEAAAWNSKEFLEQHREEMERAVEAQRDAIEALKPGYFYRDKDKVKTEKDKSEKKVAPPAAIR
jgi:Zn-dependent protease with chaperone function